MVIVTVGHRSFIRRFSVLPADKFVETGDNKTDISFHTGILLLLSTPNYYFHDIRRPRLIGLTMLQPGPALECSKVETLDFSEPATVVLISIVADNEEASKGQKQTRKVTIGMVFRKCDPDYAQALQDFTTILDDDDGGTNISCTAAIRVARGDGVKWEWRWQDIMKMLAEEVRAGRRKDELCVEVTFLPEEHRA
ncbi:hypothetical protein EV356DRAFT_210410 [Viridothelium virens]|uniref:Uncharacterized protein n=1 Tax=Viridothelium virens TaxID=1048519 RepID=A0A6A6H5S5_VIRVR|nr:hypothetical protein EV356DRAFT_210410 [Viridothelium virens]